MRDQELDQESRRVAEVLGLMIKAGGRSQRSIEEAVGLGTAGVSKILTGTIRLQYHHVLMISGALGVSPGQVFRFLYPKEEPEHSILTKVRQMQGETLPEEDSPAFDTRVRRALLRLLAEPPLENEA